jgi:C1q domain
MTMIFDGTLGLTNPGNLTVAGGNVIVPSNLTVQTNSGANTPLVLTNNNAAIVGNLGVGTSTAPTIPFLAQSNTGSGTQRTVAQLNTYESTTGTGINLDFAQTGVTVGRIASNFVAAGQMGLQFSTYNSGLNTNMTLNQNGILLKPNTPSFLAGGVASSSYTVNSTIVFNSVYYNIGSYYNASNGQFTAPVAGTYFFSAIVLINGSTTNAQYDFLLYASGNGWYAAPGRISYSYPGTSWNDGYIAVGVHQNVKMAAGDTAYCYFSTFGAGGIYTGTTWTRFSGHFVG